MVRSDSADEERMYDDKLDMDDDEDLDVEGMEAGGEERRGLQGGGVLRGVRRWGAMMGMERDGGSACVSPTMGGASMGEKTGNADVDRRIRRQIANCNERRRMQSINAGFQSLRALLPRKEGEKLSKAAILQQTAELIQSLRAERARLIEQGGGCVREETLSVGSSPSNLWKKPRLERESDSFDSSYPSSSSSIDSNVIVELQNQLEKERVMRLYYEGKLHAMNTVTSAGSTPTSTPLSPVAALAAALPLGLQAPSVSLEAASRLLVPPITTTPTTVMAADGAMGGGITTSPNSVIRPTPTQPLRVDVSLANFVTLSNPSVLSAAAAAQRSSPPSMGAAQMGGTAAMAASMAAASAAPPGSALAHRSLNAILEAIRHLEGGAFATSASPSPPTSHANLLVR